ncbi:uncharacterized protein LOC111051514 [Nilaparvata lugens]|uniref:uncharacterized protein LOC111051514 n=1 Tax=Nilaparvata lugens TaxID=108931 RepID=UPI00193C8FD8|nr:uncharacterized protein LOC111051514 [Nilaparvata lugens]
MCNVFRVVFVLYLSFSVAEISDRRCETLEDCGLGECCVGEESRNTCECSFTKDLYDEDENGVCTKLKIHSCQNKCNNNPCYPIFGSIACNCTEDYRGSDCSKRLNDKNKLRFEGLAIAYTAVARALTDRHFLVFVDSFATDFELIFEFAEASSFTYTPRHFVRYDSAKKECHRLKISKEACSLVPDRSMFGLRHTYVFGYEHHLAPSRFPKAFVYSTFLTLNNFKESQFESTYNMLNAMEKNEMLCSATVKLENCTPNMANIVKKPRGAPLTIKASIYSSSYCLEPRSISHEWRLYNVLSTVNVKMEKPPLAINAGGLFYKIGAFTYPTGLYRLDIWLSSLQVGNTTKTYNNFEHCYFEVIDMPILADIKGGASRSVYKGSDLTLDSSATYDDNYPNQGHLRYLWSCDADQPGCKEREVKDTLFRPGLQKLEGTIIFTLKAKDPISNIISNPVAQSITFVDNDIPELAIECLKNCGKLDYPAQANEAIYLQVIDLKHGQVRDLDITWKCFNQTGRPVVNFTQMLEKGHDKYQLVVNPNTLSKGKTYHFIAEGGGNGAGRASYDVTFSDVLKTGDCNFEPTSGDKMKTRFKIECNGFSATSIHKGIHSSKLQLRYEFFNTLKKYNINLSMGTYLVGSISDVLLISDNVFVLVCDTFRNCEKKELRVKINYIDLSSEVLEEFVEKFDTFIGKGRYSELLIKIAAVVQSFEKIADKESVSVKLLSALSKIPTNEYTQVEQTCTYIRFVLIRLYETFGSYIPADVIYMASKLINRISYSLLYNIEILSYSYYDNYRKDFLPTAENLISSIETTFSSKNKLVETQDVEHPSYAETLYKYRRATKYSFSSLDLISSSVVKGLLQGQQHITSEYGRVSCWFKVDTLLKMTDPIPREGDSHVQLSKELATNLSSPFDSFSVSVHSQIWNRSCAIIWMFTW